MKKLVFISAILLWTISGMAIGGIWVLEIEYETAVEKGHGYVYADYWAGDLDSMYLINDSLFTEKFFDIFSSPGKVDVYSEIEDRAYINRNAPFPNHSFIVNNKKRKNVDINAFKSVRLIKVWVRNDYVINVLNVIEKSDTSWFSNEFIRTYPVGQEVGCRLEVYNFSGIENKSPALQKLVDIYSENMTFSEPLTTEVLHLLSILTRQKIIVVELCGC